jgi:putative flippase GtrA
MCRTRSDGQPDRMAATTLDARPADVAGGARPLPVPATTWLGSDLPSAQFARFVLVGGSANLVYAGLFLFLGLAGFGDQAANAVGVLASTALANELHRRLTFRAGDRVGWTTAQWAGGGLAVVGLAASSSTLAALAVWTGPSGPLVSVLAVCAVSGAIGLARFVGLRWVLVVRPGRRLLPAAG